MSNTENVIELVCAIEGLNLNTYNTKLNANKIEKVVMNPNNWRHFNILPIDGRIVVCKSLLNIENEDVGDVTPFDFVDIIGTMGLYVRNEDIFEAFTLRLPLGSIFHCGDFIPTLPWKIACQIVAFTTMYSEFIKHFCSYFSFKNISYGQIFEEFSAQGHPSIDNRQQFFQREQEIALHFGSDLETSKIESCYNSFPFEPQEVIFQSLTIAEQPAPRPSKFLFDFAVNLTKNKTSEDCKWYVLWRCLTEGFYSEFSWSLDACPGLINSNGIVD